MKDFRSNDVLLWRLAGAATWQGVFVIALYVCFQAIRNPWLVASPIRVVSSTFAVSNWITLATLFLALAPATIAHAAVISTHQPARKQLVFVRFLPTAVAKILARRLTAQTSSLQSALGLTAFWFAHAISALVYFLRFLPRETRGPGLSHLAWLAVTLGLVYHSHVLYYSHTTLMFPSVQLHRYLRMKRKIIPGAVIHAVGIATTGVMIEALRSQLAGNGLPRLSTLWGELCASFLCVLCWSVGAVGLEVVFTERLRPEDYDAPDPLAAMEVCLEGSRGVIMRDLALHDLSLMAVDPGKYAWRRTEVFADDSGARWKPLGQHCVTILRELAVKVSMTQQDQFKIDKGQQQPFAAKWNALPAAVVKGGSKAKEQKVDALEAARCGFQRARLAARALSDYAVASHTQDKFGVLQLGDPNLGDVIVSLVSTLLAVQHLLRQLTANADELASELGPWRGTGDVSYGTTSPCAALYALQDEIEVGLHRVVDSFGSAISEALNKHKSAPPYGTSADCAKALANFLD